MDVYLETSWLHLMVPGQESDFSLKKQESNQ